MPSRDRLLDELFPTAVVAPPPPTTTPSVEEATGELPRQSNQQLDRQNAQPQKPVPCLTPNNEVKQETPPQELVEVTPNPHIKIDRSGRITRRPDRHGHNTCERITDEAGLVQFCIYQNSHTNKLEDTNAMENPLKSDSAL